MWLTRTQMSVLFGRDVKTIGKHINNALCEELNPAILMANGSSLKPTVAKFATVQMEGCRYVVRQVEHYSLDMILSVGYRVKST